jgi:hypothetical protein
MCRAIDVEMCTMSYHGIAFDPYGLFLQNVAATENQNFTNNSSMRTFMVSTESYKCDLFDAKETKVIG